MAHLTQKKLKARKVNNLKRAFNNMNTGTRTMKSKKDYSRKWKEEEYV